MQLKGKFLPDMYEALGSVSRTQKTKSKKKTEKAGTVAHACSPSLSLDCGRKTHEPTNLRTTKEKDNTAWSRWRGGAHL